MVNDPKHSPRLVGAAPPPEGSWKRLKERMILAPRGEHSGGVPEALSGLLP